MKKSIKERIEKCIEPMKIEWRIAILIGFIMLVAFSYIDHQCLTIWSTNILDCIKDNNILNYFEFTSLNLHGAPQAFVSGTLYSLIPWGIWNIPIWILQRFFGIEILKSPLSLIWSKLFLIICLIITLYYSYKLINLLTKNKTLSKWCVFLSFTSIFTYIGVFYAGQNDIIICTLGTAAIYYLIKNNYQNSKLFYILSAFAISTKYFFLFPYIVIIVFTEKDIIKILKKIFIGILPTLVFQLACYNLPMFTHSATASSATSSMIQRLLVPTFASVRGFNVSLFLMAYIVLIFVAYIKRPKDIEEKNRFLIYFSVSSLILLLILTNQEFYRPILLIPLLFVMLAQNTKKFGMNLFILSIIEFCYTMTLVLSSAHFFSTQNSTVGTLLTTILNKNILEDHSPYLFFLNHFPGSINMLGILFATVTFTGFCLLMYLNNPKCTLKLDKDSFGFKRYYVWLRMLMILPFILFAMYWVIF